MHPFINQDKVLAACKKHGMAVVAYCPIARGKVPGADALERIGKAHGKSAAQVSLRYLVQLGVCSIPRTATPEHLKQNIEVFDFKLVGRRDGRAQEAQRHQYARGQSAARAEVGYAVRRTASRPLVLLILAVSPAWPKTTSRMRATPQRSRNASRPRLADNWAWENCIGIVSEPASRTRIRCRRRMLSPAIAREKVVWDGILNDSFRRLRAKLDDNQQRKMREMQRAWIASRDKTCGSIYDYFAGQHGEPDDRGLPEPRNRAARAVPARFRQRCRRQVKAHAGRRRRKDSRFPLSGSAHGPCAAATARG